MLSDRTIRTVKLTAPILRERGLDITNRMYERLFQDKQIEQLFTQAHHGSDSQPKALAGAVLAYATHIDRLADSAPRSSASPRNTLLSKSILIFTLPLEAP